MSSWLVVAIGLVYTGVGIEQAIKGNPGGAVMWLGYAIANGGLLYSGAVK